MRAGLAPSLVASGRSGYLNPEGAGTPARSYCHPLADAGLGEAWASSLSFRRDLCGLRPCTRARLRTAVAWWDGAWPTDNPGPVGVYLGNEAPFEEDDRYI